MKKWVCTVCGYVHEGETAPEFCPVCKAGSEKFKLQDGDMSWACEHEIGVAQGSPEDIMMDLRANFEGECSENGATAGKFDLAKRAKALNLDAIHDTVHEMAKDEARHGKAFKGLLERYFG